MNRLALYRSGSRRWPLYPAGRYAIDSGASMALATQSRHSPWWEPPQVYGEMVAAIVEKNRREPDFCAPQDWPTEPAARRVTGANVREHQQRTVDNYLLLTREWPQLPWIPVLQGWQPGEHLVHARMFADAGVDLAGAVRVGIGSICRRGHTPEIVEVIEQLAEAGYALHGFGVKVTALPVIGHPLASADSIDGVVVSRPLLPIPAAGLRARRRLPQLLPVRVGLAPAGAGFPQRAEGGTRHDRHIPGRLIAEAGERGDGSSPPARPDPRTTRSPQHG
jgi:hypothetical protein